MSEIKPLGYYVLIEMVTVENVSAGGIHLGDITREQDAADVGYVRAIGPTAFVGYPGCDQNNDNTPAENWGLEIGMKIEYRKFEGKRSSSPDHKNYLYIPDSHIIGRIV